MVKTTRDVTVGINSVTGDGDRGKSSSSDEESTEYGDTARPLFVLFLPRVEFEAYPYGSSGCGAFRQNVVVFSSLTHAIPRDMISVISTCAVMYCACFGAVA